MNSDRIEQVARAVAEALGDEAGFGWVSMSTHLLGNVTLGVKPSEYLADMNTARRFREVVGEMFTRKECFNCRSKTSSMSAYLSAMHRFRTDAWDDTPAAIEALAVACGIVPPDPGPKTNE